MPFKLRIVSEEDSSPSSGYDRLFYLPEVQLGSAAGNELVLNDSQRSVSRKHARIVREGEQYVVEDSRSRNGTTLNGKPLTPQQAVTLSDGDKIRIGPFTITFQSVVDEADRSRVIAPGEGPTMMLVDVASVADELAAEIRSESTASESAEPEDRVAALADVIRRGLARHGLDPASRDEVLKNLRRKFPDRGYELVRLQKQVERVEVESQVRLPANDLHSVAYESLRVLAQRLQGGAVEFSNPAELQQFAESLRATIEVFLKMSHQLLQGRSEWKREFDIEQSIQIRATHPIKTAASPESLAAYLYNPRSPEPVNARATLLQDALQGLIYHQVAILAGYEESIKVGLQWVLQELSPQNFGGGSKSLFGGKGQWEKYVDRHRELSKEDAKRIQARFLTGFNRGYEQKLEDLQKIKPNG